MIFSYEIMKNERSNHYGNIIKVHRKCQQFQYTVAFNRFSFNHSIMLASKHVTGVQEQTSHGLKQ